MYFGSNTKNEIISINLLNSVELFLYKVANVNLCIFVACKEIQILIQMNEYIKMIYFDKCISILFNTWSLPFNWYYFA
jgi:hypothetical protein